MKELNDAIKSGKVKSLKIKIKMKRKRSEGPPMHAKQPFGKLKHDNRDKQIYPAILSKSTTQGKLHSGKSMLEGAKKRSSVKPVTKEDKKLSIKHLKETVKFNKKHAKDHQKAIKNGGSQKYNKDHIKHHEKAVKEDLKLIEDRKKIKAQRAARRPSAGKAKQMLADNSAQGHALTGKQKHFFGMIAGGKIPAGRAAKAAAYRPAALEKLKRAMQGKK